MATIHHLVQEIGCSQAFWSQFDIQSAGVTLKMSQGHQNLNISSHVPIVFLCKCGQNPLIVSGDKVQTRLIFYRFYSVVTLKIMSSPKSNQIFKPSQCYMKVGLDPLFCSRDRVQTSFFCVLSKKKIENFKALVWPWKWGQGHQNLITSFPHPSWLVGCVEA